MTTEFKTLDEWLQWQMTLHPQEIDLGLERCRAVAQRLNLLSPPFPVVTVAGTNGKGSSVALLESIFSSAGYRVGCYTSPHLLRYNERIRIAGHEVSDEALCQAFATVDAARQTVSLTYFEFGTLAALVLFHQEALDIVILEVGLGGRLDATNLVAATCALVTPIGIDHVEWLGPDRESIGFEKAGIFRTQQLAVCNEAQPPLRLLEHARQLSTALHCVERDYHYTQISTTRWAWQGPRHQYTDLPVPNLLGSFQVANAAGVLMVVELLQSIRPVPVTALRRGLISVNLRGRFQMLSTPVSTILDVAHNPLGVEVLKQTLKEIPCHGETHALVGILRDKDQATMLKTLLDTVDQWHLAPLDTPRSAKVEDLMIHLKNLGVTKIHSYPSVTAAYTHICQHIHPDARLVVFGSFFTVAEVLSHFR